MEKKVPEGSVQHDAITTEIKIPVKLNNERLVM